ncbi:MAG: sulfite exporter TauE/SafE family protein [Planctomycetaceae bacterium]|nr:sulfite exporter TauE/SafE family protein [Planctomycetaceae bacterium]
MPSPITIETLTLPLVFISGVLGSAHCIGMCGGIAATMSLGARSMHSALLRQILWSIGRTFTYVFLGMIASTVGVRVMRAGSQTILLQASFAILAGVLLILQGMHSAGWLSFGKLSRKHSPCLTTTLFAQLLKGGSTWGVMLAGIMTGFLPCGLVYSFLALAASSASLPLGIGIMLAFGLGTFPVMILTGTGFSLATLQLRQKLMRVAAICVLITGIMTVGRGITFASGAANSQPDESAEKLCPLCTADNSSRNNDR